MYGVCAESTYQDDMHIYYYYFLTTFMLSLLLLSLLSNTLFICVAIACLANMLNRFRTVFTNDELNLELYLKRPVSWCTR